jgi:beta-galactosidase
MVRPGVGERIERFVENGGTLVATYWSGIVDEHDLCFLSGFPGPLRKTLGIWAEEIDALHDGQTNRIAMLDGNALGLSATYEYYELCERIHLEGAEALAAYQSGFFAGSPALTVNSFGRGKAYYVASRNQEPFFSDFLGKIIAESHVRRAIDTQLPDGVTAQLRTDGTHDFVFLLNFNPEERSVALDGQAYTDLLQGAAVQGEVKIVGYGVRILRRDAR